jgi:hypothetical protein
MNTRQFLALFASVAVLKIVDCTFDAAVVSGLAVHIPLASATAGTLGFPLAVLGVLKLAAAAELAQYYALSQGALEPEAEEYEAAPAYGLYSRASPIQQYRRHYAKVHRNKRSAESSEAVFALVSSMDMYSCGKALVCGLEAKDPQTLSQDEQLIMALFADRKSKHYVNPGSAKAEYDLAAELGLVTKDQVACRKRYSTCPYTADEMMSALRQSQL